MGILTRRQGETFVISTDQSLEGPVSKKAPRHMNEPYRVWTGAKWSIDLAEALNFSSLDDADEYVRANYPQLSA